MTGAIGPRHYVEAVNAALGVYSRRGLRPVIETEAGAFWGQASSNLADPQVAWDGEARRWYYVMLGGDDPLNELLFAWSKTADPTDLDQGWCKFSIPTGPVLDDFPKLGFSRNHIIIGTNSGGFTIRPDVKFSRIWAIAKPPNGELSCRPAGIHPGPREPGPPLGEWLRRGLRLP